MPGIKQKFVMYEKKQKSIKHLVDITSFASLSTSTEKAFGNSSQIILLYLF